VVRNLRTRRGSTILHYISTLAKLFCQKYRAQWYEVDHWSSLGIEALRKGTDPVAVAEHAAFGDLQIWVTPLLEILNGYGSAPETYLIYLRLWAPMVHLSGVNLLEYGARETEAFERF
jgi:hypothetical protein